MFIYSIRARTLRIFALIIIAVATLAIIVTIGAKDSAALTGTSQSVDFDGVKTNEDRLKFISQFINGVSGEACENVTFSVPENFDRIMLSYNEIQKSQGLDITKYKNKKVCLK